MCFILELLCFIFLSEIFEKITTIENTINITNNGTVILNIKLLTENIMYFLKNNYTIPYIIILYININISNITNL